MKSQEPLALAAQTLAQLCDEVDSSDRIDEVLLAAFDGAKLQLETEIDRLIHFDKMSKDRQNAYKDAARYYRDQADYMEDIRSRFKARVTEVMLANPNLPFRGRLGKISCVENQPSVDYAFGDKHVTDEVIDFYGIPADYLKEKVSYEVDHARVKAELLAGKELPWARLKPTSHHVRFPAAKKPKQVTIGEQDND